MPRKSAPDTVITVPALTGELDGIETKDDWVKEKGSTGVLEVRFAVTRLRATAGR